MTNQWTWAVLLSSALVVGCGTDQPETTQNPESETPVAVEEAAVPEASPAGDSARNEPAASPRRDNSAAGRAASPSAPAASRDLSAGSGSSRATSGDNAARRTAAAPAAPRWREVTVPAGTALPLELLTALSSETARVETPVRARLRQAVVVNEYIALPAGTVLHGTVTDVDRAGRVQGRARLAFRFTEAELNGGREELSTNPVSFQGEATKGEDATKIGAGAVGGAIIGGILGGGDGAAKGAAIGGAAGTGAVLATRGREVSLAAGTDIAATLASPLSVRASLD
jgi:hypothetical protein